MIKKLILKVCKLTGLTPYDVMESFVSGVITAALLMASIYPTCWMIATVGNLIK